MQDYQNTVHHHHHYRKGSGSVLAYAFIIIGIVYLLKHIGWDLNLPGVNDAFQGIGSFFSTMGHFISKIGWPLVIIFIGIMLLMGRKLIGGLILAFLLLIILPHFLIIPGFLFILFLPVILIICGAIILSKLF